MKLTDEELTELKSAMNLLHKDGLDDGDIGYMHRAKQINIINRMIDFIQKSKV
jgi:hypothetical protein